MQPWRRTDWTLPDWTAQAWTREHNLRHSRQMNAACARHMERFPHDLVRIELDAATLLSLRALLHQSRASADLIAATAPVTGPPPRSGT